jgi:ABC-type sugar transport system ATPase subunit
MATILSIRGISKGFPGVQALRDISFNVEEGEIHAVLGENGAGKSTLMQIIAGALPADDGTLILNGEQIHFHNPADAQAKGVAIVYQELNLAPNLSIAENIFLGLEPRSFGHFLDWNSLRNATRQILQKLGIRLDPETIVGDLTVAQQQLIEICKSLIRNPRLLILDEPTSSLSETESQILFEVIADLKQHGVTVLYISHRLQEVFELCDTLTVLRDGRHVRTMPISGTSEAEAVRLMVGRELLAFHRTPPDHPGDVVLEVNEFTRADQYHNVSFTLRRGEIVVLAGLIGAGRSEVALGIFGSPPPERGELSVSGKPVRVHRPQDAMAAGIAFAPEDRKSLGLILGDSVASNLSLAALPQLSRHSFVDQGAVRSLVDRFVRRLNIRTPDSAQQVGLLSGGNQQKVMLAKWLAMKPKVLIVDEPTRGVDVGTKAEIYTLLNELAQTGIAVLVISSDLLEVLALADRILVMRHGILAGELSRTNATEEKIMSLAALGN